MVTYSINNWAELVSNSPYNTGDVININTSFATTDNINVVNLGDATVNGNNHTITFQGRTKGLFIAHGATVSYLNIDGNSTTLAQNEAFFLAYSVTVQDQWATICNCSITNGSMSNYCGGFIARYSTRYGTQTTNFDNCSVTNLILGSRFCGGYCAEYAKNINILNCTANVTIGAATEAGGFIAHNLLGNNTLSGCQATIDQITEGACGGLISRIGGGTTLIEKCSATVTNGVSGPYSAILAGGMTTSVENGTTLTINDSYAIGSVSNYAGALVGYHTYNGTSELPNTVYINRCYHAGDVIGEGKSICGWYTDTNRPFIVTDTVVNSTNINRGTGVITLIRVDTSLQGIDNDLPDGDDDGQTNIGGFADNWSTDIWSKGENPGEYPFLQPSIQQNELGGNPVANSLACLVPGTKIFIPGGSKNIEKIQSGDLVIGSSGNKCRVIENVRFVRPNEPKFIPIFIPRGCLQDNLPFKDTYISRYHKMLINDKMLSYFELHESGSVPKGIVDLSSDVTYNNQEIVYHHLILEEGYRTYFANGIIVESLPKDNVILNN